MNLKTKTLWWSWRYVIYIIHDVFFRDYTMLSDSDCSLSNLLSFQGLCCIMNMYYETLQMLSSLTCPLDALRHSHHLPVTWFCSTSTPVPPYLNRLNRISCLLTVTFCLSVNCLTFQLSLWTAFMLLNVSLLLILPALPGSDPYRNID